MTTTYENLNEDQWLLKHARDITSLSGEDGIIQKIFETIAPANRWCVEFGAWDGQTFSNTYHLMKQGEWSGVFVEANARKFQELLKTYEGNSRAHSINRFVTFEGENCLDSILSQTPIAKEFDLLSIDIDGNDFHIWESLKSYSPRVVIIEFNPTIPSHIEFVQPRDMSLQQGNSLLSLVKLGKQKGYELICVTRYNGIFVRSSLFHAFHINDNSIERLRPDNRPEFYIFQLMDGTFVVGGQRIMVWQGLPIRQKDFQVLPKLFRVYPPDAMSWWRLFLKRVWRWFFLKGVI
jgi:hypothetical protein